MQWSIVGPCAIRALAVAAMLAAAACGAPPTAPGAAASPSAQVSVPPGAEQAVARARADAASRTGIESSRWQPVEVAARQWPDGGLGCPGPGQVYAQVVSPGYLIRLQSGRRVLEYHSGPARVVYCGG